MKFIDKIKDWVELKNAVIDKEKKKIEFKSWKEFEIFKARLKRDKLDIGNINKMEIRII